MTSECRVGLNSAVLAHDPPPWRRQRHPHRPLGFDEVVRAALDRVERCDCGEETSCYDCLRGYRNQPFHEQLRRGAAIDFLRPLAPAARIP